MISMYLTDELLLNSENFSYKLQIDHIYTLEGDG